jgi:alpha,alpha-trehalase
MKKLLLFLLAGTSLAELKAQTVETPDKLWGHLFIDVQTKRIFPDNKTFVDAVPKYVPEVILKKYAEEKGKEGFDLKAFVLENFNPPVVPNVKVKGNNSLIGHLEELWDVLTRKADSSTQYSSLLPLPGSYIVPGGRFREIYYWDSYFTMQGLAVTNRYDLIENMITNFQYLIDTYGHIPNGNRNYFLGRSQPPYFALMVELLHSKNGDSTYRKFFPAMEKEYAFWMDGITTAKAKGEYRRLVRMPDGSLLNRYWDDIDAPRQESYAEDLKTSKEYTRKDGMVFRNLRGGAESGWDFSSRWFGDTMHLNTIETSNIAPVDLNGLLYAYETILAKAAKSMGLKEKADFYTKSAEKRKATISKYCWNAKLHYFFDYDFRQKHTTDRWSLAGTMPLFVQLATKEQAVDVKKQIEEKFLKDGGLASTVYHTGQQWDAPNGWAPLQYVGVQGLLNYHFDDLAKTSAERWMAVNERVFAATGKMLEKYNVENIHLESGGGEYPTQDGFGWSNGVYLKFYYMFKKRAF